MAEKRLWEGIEGELMVRLKALSRNLYRILKLPIEKAGKFDHIQSVWVKINVIWTRGIVGYVCFYFTFGGELCGWGIVGHVCYFYI